MSSFFFGNLVLDFEAAMAGETNSGTEVVAVTLARDLTYWQRARCYINMTH
jgi:hypothetical protein